MPWTSDRWPPGRGGAIDTDLIINEVRAALAERNNLVPAGRLPGAFSRWDPLLGTPKGGAPTPNAIIANFQYQVQEMLTLVWPLRWWDAQRLDLYTLVNLCQDAFGRSGWRHDLTAEDGQGLPLNRWTPPYATLFAELRAAINRLDQVRIMPTGADSVRHDSVFRLTFGIGGWPADRAATFALFDGQDDGQTVGLEFDVGMGGEVIDGGSTQEWFLESRQFQMVFATGALADCTLRRAWLDFATAAPAGTADFSDTFTAELVDGAGVSLGTFPSDDYGAKRVEVPAGSVNRNGNTVLTVCSTRADAADRPVWAPPGPDYSSTYREGLAVTGPVRLIAEVDFGFHG